MPTEKGNSLTICEIGCGGGDNLIAIQEWCKKKFLKVEFIGIDLNPHCIEVAKKKFDLGCSQFIISDYQLTIFKKRKPDIIFSSLFCHHFSNAELIAMLYWMKQNAVVGFFINDLLRHPLAYYFMKLSSKLFSSSYLVKNDGPSSVLRAFKRSEWESILKSVGIEHYLINWKWAFRHLITVDLSKEDLQPNSRKTSC